MTKEKALPVLQAAHIPELRDLKELPEQVWVARLTACMEGR
jgi:hypothetical protein